MTTVNLHALTEDQLTEHLVAWFKQILPLEEHRRLMVPTLRELATGQPVQPERLAALAGVPVDRTRALLRQAPSEWDVSGTRLVGLGLTSKPTPVTPTVDVSQVRQAVCAAQNFLRSADAASQWHAEHPEALLLPVADMFELHRRAVVRVWGDQLPG
ncbi:MAG TPA: organomercurial lyase [Actinomycetes bacterium]|jgi:hypothetical protein|nr:organomercurial lyase [Actinomycetes bacterium]